MGWILKFWKQKCVAVSLTNFNTSDLVNSEILLIFAVLEQNIQEYDYRF